MFVGKLLHSIKPVCPFTSFPILASTTSLTSSEKPIVSKFQRNYLGELHWKSKQGFYISWTAFAANCTINLFGNRLRMRRCKNVLLEWSVKCVDGAYSSESEINGQEYWPWRLLQLSNRPHSAQHQGKHYGHEESIGIRYREGFHERTLCRVSDAFGSSITVGWPLHFPKWLDGINLTGTTGNIHCVQ